MSQSPNTEFRDRVIMPVAIPVGALAFIAFITFTVSRVLLRVPHQIATAVALIAAFNILTACTYLSLSPKLERPLKLLLVGVVVLPVVFGAAAAFGVVKIKGVEEHNAKPAGPTVALVAKNLTFDKTELDVKAAEPFKIAFDNEDSAIPHNVAIFKEDPATNPAAEVLFKGALATGPVKTTYNVKALPAGEYHFHCDVHPVMNGTVKAS
jgi:plastocyanin